VSGPLLRPLPALLRHRNLLSLGLTLFLAPSLLLLRNLASDHVAYGVARDSAQAAMYRAYLRDGRLYASAARRDLPRIAFAEAKRAGASTGFRDFVREFGDSPFKAEALSLLHRSALDEAKKANSAAALRAYLKDYTGSPHLAEAAEALHQRYAGAIEEFRKQASRQNPQVLLFVERLIRYLESSGVGSVRMSFEAPSNQKLKEVDRGLAARPVNFMERIEPIAEHFGPQSTVRMQENIVSLLTRSFASVFPADVLAIADKPVAGGLQEPSLLIRYEVQPSGTSFSPTDSAMPIKPVYIGIRIVFRAAFTLPDASPPLELRFAVEPPKHFIVNYTTRGPAILSEPTASEVYSTMATRAFDELAVRLPAAFFAPGSAALLAATGKP